MAVDGGLENLQRCLPAMGRGEVRDLLVQDGSDPAISRRRNELDDSNHGLFPRCNSETTIAETCDRLTQSVVVWQYRIMARTTRGKSMFE